MPIQDAVVSVASTMSHLFSYLPASIMMDRQAISDLAGSASFTIWLFAQSPQLLENYKRGSVEGLSPVFLIQWMLGDATNLIGCVLTGQLPFQIAVATYFCCVDLCIMVQYIYYWRKARASMRRIAKPVRSRIGSLISHTSTLHPSAIAPTETSELLPASGRSQHWTTGSRSPTLRRGASSRPPISRSNSSDLNEPFYSQTATYRALRDAAMSVAQLADEAARRREATSYFDGAHHHPYPHPSRQTSSRHRSSLQEQSQSRSSSRHSSSAAVASRLRTRRGSRRTQPADFRPATLSPTREGLASLSDSEDGEIPQAMLQSTSSLQSQASTSSSSSSSSYAPALGGTRASAGDLQQSQDSLTDRRGRDMTRTAIKLGLMDQSDDSQSPTPSDGTARRPSKDTTAAGNQIEGFADRRQIAGQDVADPAAHHSKVDEGLSSEPPSNQREASTRWRSRVDRSGSRPAKGRTRSTHSIRRGFGMAMMGLMLVVALAEGPEGAQTRPTSSGAIGPWYGSGLRDASRIVAGSILEKLRHPASLYLFAAGSDAIGEASVSPDAPAPSWERVIGRMSAWSCTVLYMTSRIPQIWENYVRRSVEGLSILLFMAAFLGNLTYSISILSSPSAVGAGAREYLEESVPFLLGSGGTLIFDVTIMIQWWLWSGKAQHGGGEPKGNTRSKSHAEASTAASGVVEDLGRTSQHRHTASRNLSTPGGSPTRERGSRRPAHLAGSTASLPPMKGGTVSGGYGTGDLDLEARALAPRQGSSGREGKKKRRSSQRSWTGRYPDAGLPSAGATAPLRTSADESDRQGADAAEDHWYERMARSTPGLDQRL